MPTFLHRISALLIRQSPGSLVIFALIAFLFFMVFVLPSQASQAQAASGAATSPDTSFYYTPSQLYAMAESYGPDGRAAYIRARFTFDLVWPLVYFAFLVTALSWLYTRTFPAGSPWRLANLTVVFGTLFDYLENISTSLVMARYPAPTPLVDALAGGFTLLKWVGIGAAFVLLVLGSVLWLAGRFVPKRV